MDKIKHTSEDGKVTYYILDLDAGGYPRSNTVDLQPLLRQELLRTSKSSPTYTDVVICSHGWQTRRDSDGSVGIANRVVRQLEACKPANRHVLYIAVCWPSFISSVFETNPEDDPKSLISRVMQNIRQVASDGEKTVVDPTADFSVTETAKTPESLTAADECESVCTKFIEDDANASAHGNTSSVAAATAAVASMSLENGKPKDSLPPDVCDSVAKLVNELSKQSGRVNSDDSSLLDDGEKYGAASPQMIEAAYQRVKAKNSKPPQREATVQSRSFSIVGMLAAGVGSTAYDLANTIFDVIFGTFERRAAIVGSRGVHWCLADLMEHAPKSTRFHLLGHSLGCHVVQSAAIGRAPGSKLSRKIHTMFLGQAAVPEHVYERGGPYRPIVSKLRPIAGPILATTFVEDPALIAYDMFLPRPIGRFGFFTTSPFPYKTIALEEAVSSAKQKVDFQRETVYKVEGGSIITGHGDISDRELMDLFWQAASVDIHEKDAEVVESSKLPYGFWTNYRVRTENYTRICSIM